METPSSNWAAKGEEDPHGNMYNRERRTLALGDFTDDELANAIARLYGDRVADINEVIAGRPKMPIVYLTAAKERIRWLSRRLESKLGSKARDLFWNESPSGTLPDGTFVDSEIVGLIRYEVVPVERAETFLVRAKFGDTLYDLHTCHAYSEALERNILLEKLL